MAICKPFLSHTMSKLSRAYKFILVSTSVLWQWVTLYLKTIICLGNLDDINMLSSSAGESNDYLRQPYWNNISSPFPTFSYKLQTLFTLHLDETYLICVPKQDYNHLFVVSTFLLFVIPMSIITILYVLIGLQLRKSKIVQRGAVNGSSVRLKVNIFLLM